MKSRQQMSKYLVASLISLVTFLVYLPSLQNEFVYWDDNVYVYENFFIRSLDTQLFKSSFLGFHATNWHPLTWLSHAVDYAIWGLNPLGHHLTNNILHALNAFIVVLLIVRLMTVYKARILTERAATFPDDRGILIAGATAGLLFGLHPIHVESVAWVAERKDVLCAFFFLLSLSTYTGYVISETDRGGAASQFFNKKYFLTMVFFVLALFSKPMAVSLPLVLLILDWHPFERIRSLKTLWTCFSEKIPFILLSLLSAALTVLAQKEAIKDITFIPLSERTLVAAKSLISYLWKMILPVNLTPYYPYPHDISLFSPEYLGPVILTVGITSACIAAARRRKLLLATWGYYVIMLIPVLGVIQVGDQSMADRYTYLPSLGPFLLIGLITANAYEKVTVLSRWRGILRIAGLFIALAIFVSLSYSTIKQIGVWKNSVVFWNYVIEKEPSRVPVAHNNLGVVYKTKGLLDPAIEQYRTALRLKPDFAEALNNLGNAYASKGLHDMAIEQYRMALSIKTDYADASNNLGAEYFSQGLFDLAIEYYRTALRLKPDFAEAHFNLGLAYLNKGSKDMARTEFELGLEAKPDDYRARQFLNSIISK